MKTKQQDATDTRRDFIKAIAYVAPVVVTLKAAPSFATNGSGARQAERAPRRSPRRR